MKCNYAGSEAAATSGIQIPSVRMRLWRRVICLIGVLCTLQSASAGAPSASERPVKDPVPVAETMSEGGALQNIHLETSVQLFTVLAALNVAGFNYEAPGHELSELRKRIREDLAGLDEDLRKRLRTFYQTHRQGEDESKQQAAYVSLALLLSPAPDFSLETDRGDLPADVGRIVEFADLLKEFYQRSSLELLWPDYQLHYRAQLKTYRSMIRSVTQETLSYFRTSERVPLDRHIVLIPDLLNVRDIVNARNWVDSYYIVIGPAETPDDNYIHLQHEYLHFLIDPLVEKFNASVRRKQGLLAVVREQPKVKLEYVNRLLLVTTESLIESILLRLHPTEDLECSVASRFREGLIFVPYFLSALEQYEKNDLISFPSYLANLLQGVPESVKEDGRKAAQWHARCAVDASRHEPRDEVVPVGNPRKGLLEEVTQLLKADDLESARAKTQELLKLEPDNAFATFYLAQIATRQGQHESAFEYDKRTLQSPSAPRWIRAWSLLRMGNFLAYSGRFSEARERFERILLMDGELKGAHEKADQALKELPAVNE